MKNIRVALKENPYDIVTGYGILEKLPGAIKKLDVGMDAVIVTNPLVGKLYAKKISSAFMKAGFTVKIFEVLDSERSKSLAVASKLVGDLSRYAVNKRIFVVALGGGVVGDLAGFVASIYKRGVPLIQVPTTLLAQIDSAIGGKVAVDLPEGKNLAGSFYQPRLVWADASVLSSLSRRQIQNGLAEAVKYGVIKDAHLFSFIEKNVKPLLLCDKKALSFVIASCAAIKASVVVLDEKETKGIRTILNFGHTVGHAIETACGYDKYHHGEAVALGMRAACRMSVAARLMPPREAMRVEMLLTQIGLPEAVAVIKGSMLSRIIDTMKFDKKFMGKTTRFVLAKGIGRVVLVSEVPLAFVTGIVRGLMV